MGDGASRAGDLPKAFTSYNMIMTLLPWYVLNAWNGTYREPIDACRMDGWVGARVSGWADGRMGGWVCCLRWDRQTA